MDDTAVERVEISGAALSLVLGELGSSSGDFDGLLFGRLHRKTSQNLQDEGADFPAIREERTAIITGCCCTGTLMSFYDGAGDVEESKLARLIGKRQKWGNDPLIGWVVGRRNTSMRPSMREAAVTASLSKNAAAAALPASDLPLASPPNRNGTSISKVSLGLPYSTSNSASSSISLQRDEVVNSAAAAAGDHGEDQQPPFLFLLITDTVSANSIQTHEYRAFQYERASSSFHPRLVVVRNVGALSCSKATERDGLYGSFVPVAPLPWLLTTKFCIAEEEDEADSWRLVGSSASPGSEKIGRAVRQKQQSLLEMYADGFSVDHLHNVVRNGGGIQELELLYSRMLLKMQKIAGEVRQSSEALQKQESLNAKLRAAVAE